MPKQWLTVEQVSEILQVQPSTVRAYINLRENPLPAVPLGKRGGYRIDPDDLDKWMQERKNRPREEE